MKKVTKFLANTAKQPEVTTGSITLILLIGLILGSPYFLDTNNIDSLQTSIGPAILIAVGMTLLFITGAFDLSVGATMGLSGLIAAWFLSQGLPWQLAFLSGICFGALVGLFNGFLVSWISLNPLIVTLGSFYILRGLIDLMIGGGRPQPWMYFSTDNVDSSFYEIGSLHLGPIHIILAIGLLVALLGDFFLRRHRFGRNLFFAGDSRSTARTLGIPVKSLQIYCYIVCGILAAIAGMFVAARTGLASRHIGSGVELEIIIACLIGGSSIAGGKGSVLGSVLGVIFITLINNAFNLFEVAPQWQKVVVGLVLICVVVSDGWRQLRQRIAY